jgi:hypothetical protein
MEQMLGMFSDIIYCRFVAHPNMQWPLFSITDPQKDQPKLSYVGSKYPFQNPT